MSGHPLVVVIAGGGVAALETLLALRRLAEDRVEIELLAPQREFLYRPLSVAEPFELGEAPRFDLDEIAADQGARLRIDGLASVDPGRRAVRTRSGAEMLYDALVVAVGTTRHEAVPGALSFGGPEDTGAYRDLLREAERGEIRNLVFAIPQGATWPLPMYELALLTAVRLRSRGAAAKLTVVTPEDAPLGMFGPRASEAVGRLLSENGVEVRTSAIPVAAADGTLEVVPDGAVVADRVVAMPHLRGPGVEGLPHDEDGFLRVDANCRVRGVEGVYAAGDATAFPVKQGGIATQQADAVAEALAAEAGAPVEPEGFRPVLRGVLLTGAGARFLKAEISGGRGDVSEVSEDALWWPGGKVVGRYLSHYLAHRVGPVDAPEPLAADAIPIEIALDGAPGGPAAPGDQDP
jgi:sulfide:quinone oxidoreductase